MLFHYYSALHNMGSVLRVVTCANNSNSLRHINLSFWRTPAFPVIQMDTPGGRMSKLICWRHEQHRNIRCRSRDRRMCGAVSGGERSTPNHVQKNIWYRIGHCFVCRRYQDVGRASWCLSLISEGTVSV